MRDRVTEKIQAQTLVFFIPEWETEIVFVVMGPENSRHSLRTFRMAVLVCNSM